MFFKVTSLESQVNFYQSTVESQAYDNRFLMFRMCYNNLNILVGWTPLRSSWQIDVLQLAQVSAGLTTKPWAWCPPGRNPTVRSGENGASGTSHVFGPKFSQKYPKVMVH